MCIRDSVGYKGQRNDVIVNYLVLGGNYGNNFLGRYVSLFIKHCDMQETEVIQTEEAIFRCH